MNCNYCQKVFSDVYKLKVHIYTHTKPFKCKKCGKCFSQKGNLEAHERIHSGIRPFKCTLCSKSFIQLSHLNQHNRWHLNIRPYKCDQCDNSFVQLSNLNDHKKMHQSKAIGTATDSAIDSVKMELEGNLESVSDANVIVKQEDVTDFGNQEEDDRAAKSLDLWINSVFKKDVEKERNGEKLNFVPQEWWFQCQVCKVLIQNKDKFLEHKLKHSIDPKEDEEENELSEVSEVDDEIDRESDVMCLDNDELSSTDDEDERCSIDMEDNKEDNFEELEIEEHVQLDCSVSDYEVKVQVDSTFEDLSDEEEVNLQRETEETSSTIGNSSAETILAESELETSKNHIPVISETEGSDFSISGERNGQFRMPFTCVQCASGFKFKALLNTHLAIVHLSKCSEGSGGKPLYGCGLCPTTFPNRTLLVDHAFIHTNEERYKCPYCVKGFILRTNFTAHLRVCHAKED